MKTSSEHPAIKRFNAMTAGFNSENIVQFAVRDGYMPNVESARSALTGVLQWLAVHAVDEHADAPFVMMKGDVDQMYHALLLNTRVYLHFCRDYIGFFIHHTPLDDLEAANVIVEGGIDYTVMSLKSAFGPELSPALNQWVNAHQRGELQANSVSCIANPGDRAPEMLLGIADFRSFWDRNPHSDIGNA
jgi:hypothetical protein